MVVDKFHWQKNNGNLLRGRDRDWRLSVFRTYINLNFETLQPPGLLAAVSKVYTLSLSPTDPAPALCIPLPEPVTSPAASCGSIDKPESKDRSRLQSKSPSPQFQFVNPLKSNLKCANTILDSWLSLNSYMPPTPCFPHIV